MSNTETGGPAFPWVYNEKVIKGMTLRDYFAAKALQGIMTDPGVLMGADRIAEWAYAQADAMLEARKA